MKRLSYPTDLIDTEWAIIEPLIPPARPGGRPRSADMREVATPRCQGWNTMADASP